MSILHAINQKVHIHSSDRRAISSADKEYINYVKCTNVDVGQSSTQKHKQCKKARLLKT